MERDEGTGVKLLVLEVVEKVQFRGIHLCAERQRQGLGELICGRNEKEAELRVS